MAQKFIEGKKPFTVEVTTDRLTYTRPTVVRIKIDPIRFCTTWVDVYYPKGSELEGRTIDEFLLVPRFILTYYPDYELQLLSDHPSGVYEIQAKAKFFGLTIVTASETFSVI